MSFGGVAVKVLFTGGGRGMGKPTGLVKEQRRALDRLKTVPGIARF